MDLDETKEMLAQQTRVVGLKIKTVIATCQNEGILPAAVMSALISETAIVMSVFAEAYGKNPEQQIESLIDLAADKARETFRALQRIEAEEKTNG